MEVYRDEGGGRRRQYTAGERTESGKLRDFLRVKEDSNNNINMGDSTNSLAGLTLDDVLTGGKSPSGRAMQPDRTTLFDIIQADPNSASQHKNNWQFFREKLRLKRAGSAWTSSVPIPASDIPLRPASSNRMMLSRHNSRHLVNPGESTQDPDSVALGSLTSTNSKMLQRSDTRRESYELSHDPDSGELTRSLSSLPSNNRMLMRRNTSRMPERQASRMFPIDLPHEEENEENEEDSGSPGGDQQQEKSPSGEPHVRMSLMALLAETDREMGLDGSAYMDEEEDDEDEEEEEANESGMGYSNCCVCMVRHKGAAFIPCGHTFCRLCSRELWVQRGNCPLCNNFILEILDIF